MSSLFVSQKEVAAILGVSVCAISRAKKSGMLDGVPSVLVGGRMRWLREDIERLAHGLPVESAPAGNAEMRP